MTVEIQFGGWLKNTSDNFDSIIQEIQSLLAVLENEEYLIVEHRIGDYETALLKKEVITQNLSMGYDRCFNAMNQLIVLCKAAEVSPMSGETISAVRNTCNKFWQSILPQVPDLDRRILDRLVKSFSVKVDQLLALQTEIKPRIERNVILMSKLLDSHRQSYLFWRELISRESSGYDEYGQKKQNHSLSYFVTKA